MIFRLLVVGWMLVGTANIVFAEVMHGAIAREVTKQGGFLVDDISSWYSKYQLLSAEDNKNSWELRDALLEELFSRLEGDKINKGVNGQLFDALLQLAEDSIGKAKEKLPPHRTQDKCFRGNQKLEEQVERVREQLAQSDIYGMLGYIEELVGKIRNAQRALEREEGYGEYDVYGFSKGGSNFYDIVNKDLWKLAKISHELEKTTRTQGLELTAKDRRELLATWEEDRANNSKVVATVLSGLGLGGVVAGGVVGGVTKLRQMLAKRKAGSDGGDKNKSIQGNYNGSRDGLFWHGSCLESVDDKQMITAMHIDALSDSLLEQINQEQEKLKQEQQVQTKAEEEKLANNAAKYGFTLQSVPGDGNCFFHAVLDQLKRLELAGEWNFGSLRELAVNHMQANSAEYSNSLDGTMEAYITNMRRSGTYADHLVIVALARALDVNLVIIRDDDTSPQVVRKSPRAGASTLYLGYQERKQHYYSLVPLLYATIDIPLDEAHVDSWQDNHVIHINNHLSNITAKPPELVVTEVSKSIN